MAGASSCIVVGYDGSDSAREALRWARRQLAEDGKLIVVTSFAPPSDWLGHPLYQRMLDDHRGRAQAVLDSLVKEDGELLEGVDYELELIGDRPADAIVQVAKTRDADLIVVGSRGLGRARSQLGSVSHELLHLSDRPVTVIPPV
jgi:nucleotide-binding universal stress UspA family protein